MDEEPWKLTDESKSHNCDIDRKRMKTVYLKNELIQLSKTRYIKKKAVYDAIAHEKE